MSEGMPVCFSISSAQDRSGDEQRLAQDRTVEDISGAGLPGPRGTLESGVRLIARDLLPGQMVGENFRIEAELGRGGMGVVYRAKDTWLGRAVALKVVDSGRNDNVAHARLQQEAQRLASVRSANVVEIFAFGRQRGSYFIAMEYVRGQSLSDLLEQYRRRGERMPVHRAVTILARIAEGLDAVHASGIVHRDVKPANIVIEEDTGRPVLVDFGLAIRREAVEGCAFEGTPHYMAPEQFGALELEVCPASDLYALACIAFEMLTGRPPFPEDNLMKLFSAHCFSPPPSVSAVCPELACFDPIFARALAKPPRDRYPDGLTFVRDVLSAAAEVGTLPPIPLPPHSPRASGKPNPMGLDRPLRVLAVDDDPAFGRLAAKAVELAVSGAASITIARSGAEALAEARRLPPDLVLLDLDMPGLDGLETLSLFRALSGCERARVVVLSGRVGAQERWRFSVLGVRDFVPKPIDFRQLIHTLQSLVERAEWRTAK